MKTSIIYAVAVSLALLSTSEIHLGKRNFDKKSDTKRSSTNKSFVPNANKKETVLVSKAAAAKTTCSSKSKNTLLFLKPALVLEAEPFVEVMQNEKQWTDTSAIIEDTAKEETKALDFLWSNAVAYLEETIEMPNASPKKGVSDWSVQQEVAIIEDTDSNEPQTLDYHWIDTLSLLNEIIEVPNSDSVSETTFDFTIIGEDDSLLQQPLNYNWIEALQMLDEPIVTPLDVEKE